jgi:NTE family protein
MTQSLDPERSAIVLGGGGIAGIAWELGLLSGLLDEDISLQDADLVVGTSAGSMVGALLRFDRIDDSYRQQLEPVPSSYKEPQVGGAGSIDTLFRQALAGATGEQDARARVGASASQVTAGQTDEQRVATFRETFPEDVWPAEPLAITAVDAADGEFRVFTAADGVPITRAIAASCSVPFVWSPVRADGRSYIDGGVRSVTNADVAEGAGRVLVVACRDEPLSPTGPSLGQAVEAMRSAGAVVEVVIADVAAQEAFGNNSLAITTREPSARAGRVQAGVVAERIREFWQA